MELGVLPHGRFGVSFHAGDHGEHPGLLQHPKPLLRVASVQGSHGLEPLHGVEPRERGLGAHGPGLHADVHIHAQVGSKELLLRPRPKLVLGPPGQRSHGKVPVEFQRVHPPSFVACFEVLKNGTEATQPALLQQSHGLKAPNASGLFPFEHVERGGNVFHVRINLFDKLDHTGVRPHPLNSDRHHPRHRGGRDLDARRPGDLGWVGPRRDHPDRGGHGHQNHLIHGLDPVPLRLFMDEIAGRGLAPESAWDLVIDQRDQRVERLLRGAKAVGVLPIIL